MKLTTKQKLDIVRLYKTNKYNIASLSRETGYYSKTISNILDEYNIDRSKSQRNRKTKYTFNKDIFNNINNEQKAYWLGFLLGDGSISHNNLRIELSEKDKGHIAKFKKFMESDNPIKPSRKNCYTFNINNTNFVESLSRFGLVQNKTYLNVTTPYSYIPKRLLTHFYRGLFDADGWISVSNGHKRQNGTYAKRYDIGFSSYNDSILYEIQSFYNNHLQKKHGYIIKRQKPGKTKTQQTCQLIYGGRNLFINLGDLIYKNSSTYLDRKYELYQQCKTDILSKKYDL